MNENVLARLLLDINRHKHRYGRFLPLRSSKTRSHVHSCLSDLPVDPMASVSQRKVYQPLAKLLQRAFFDRVIGWLTKRLPLVSTSPHLRKLAQQLATSLGTGIPDAGTKNHKSE